MARGGRRIPIGPKGSGIYQDEIGGRISVFAGPAKMKGRETRFAPMDTYCPKLGAVVTEDRLIAWRLRRLAELTEKKPTRAVKGSLAADYETVLTMIPPGSWRDDIESLLRVHWLPEFGDRDRHTIERGEIRQQVTAWQALGHANVSINHRVRALRTVYQMLGDEDESFPTDKIEKLPDADPEPRGLPWAIVEFILDQIPNRGRAPRRLPGAPRLCPVCRIREIKNYRNKRCAVCRHAPGAPVTFAGTVQPDYRVQRQPQQSENKIRLRMMAWMGIPQMGIERLKPEHVQPHPSRAERVFLVPRKKGGRRVRKARPGQWYPVLPPAAEAIADYDLLKLWGRTFARRAVSRMWRTAIINAKARAAEHARETGDTTILDALIQYVPENCRPYDLRHSFLTETYRASGDGRIVGTVGQHTPGSKQWERYTVAAVPEKVEAAFAKMAERWTGPTPAAPLRIVKRGGER